MNGPIHFQQVPERKCMSIFHYAPTVNVIYLAGGGMEYNNMLTVKDMVSINLHMMCN